MGFGLIWLGFSGFGVCLDLRFWCESVRCWLRICLFSCLTWIVEFGLGWVVSAERWFGAFWVVTDVLFALILGCW